MVKTWMADQLFPALQTFYSQVEAITGRKFFFPMPLYRPFLSIEELNDWTARTADPVYAPFVEKVHDHSPYQDLKDPIGGLQLSQCGFVDTGEYILAVRDWILRDNFLLHAPFDFGDLDLSGNTATYKGYSAEKVLFCQGVHNNPWFQWLPVRPLKGETISISSGFSQRVIVNRGVYVLPVGEEGVHRVGSTYHFHDRVEEITPAAKDELVQKLDELVNYPYQVTDQQWGWRPTTPDRRPMLGAHPEHESLIVFNGLGTKGVSLAPHFSHVLIRWLENEVPLDKDVDIARYKSLYWNSP